MSDARVRRFPPLAGRYGWAGVVFIIAALASQVVAVVYLFWTVINRDGRYIVPLIVFFFLSFPLAAAAGVLWWLGMKRSGTLGPSTISRPRQRQMFGALAVMNIGSLLGIGTSIYLALRLEGNRRFAIAIVPILLASLVSYLALLKLRQIQNRPAPRSKEQTIIFVGLSLGGSALLVITGLF